MKILKNVSNNLDSFYKILGRRNFEQKSGKIVKLVEIFS